MPILRSCELGIEGDLISFRYGFDGYESKEVFVKWSNSKHLGVRFALSINTWYPRVAGGYYFNRSLQFLISHCLQELGVCHIISELWQLEGFVPVEQSGHFAEAEDFVLAGKHSQIVGTLSTWQFRCGGGGKLYGDNLIFDFLLPLEMANTFRVALRAFCARKNVMFNEMPDGDCKERPKNNFRFSFGSTRAITSSGRLTQRKLFFGRS